MEIDDLQKLLEDNVESAEFEFYKGQCIFLSDMYKRYNNDLDNANIVMFFAKNLHLKILREREKDLNYNISFQSFWLNRHKVVHEEFRIINIANETGLPKETTRRKIQNLIKLKVLKKIGKKVFWSPPEVVEVESSQEVDNHIKILTTLTNLVIKKLNLSFSNENINAIIKKNFSFFWYHYLQTQLKFLKIWKLHLVDLELLLISIECSVQGQLIFSNKRKLNKENVISATTISNITGIPRVTCIRKLKKLYKLKLISRDNLTKRYSINIQNLSNNKIFTKETKIKVKELFGSFLVIILRALENAKKVRQ